MSNSKNKRKTATAIAATAVTAAVLLAGTYAWQNMNQEATNLAAGANPGGRLHDDFNGTNKDVYVENFANEKIYARIQLTEYMEIGQDAGKNLGSTEERNVELITTGAIYDQKETWETHDFAGGNSTDSYWTWDLGGQTVYMPTFNMNKDSLAADINGTFAGPDKVIDDENADRYKDYKTYEEGQTASGTEIYDADTDNSDDEGANAVAGTNITMVEGVVHTAQSTIDGQVISMADWMELSADAKADLNAWVYDIDGWAYWSQPIEPNTATGLLLDEIQLKKVVNDNWFYAINVVAQFITADDIGIKDGSGFYDGSKGTAPSPNALALLASIGVDITGPNQGETKEDGIDIGYNPQSTYGANGYMKKGETLQLGATAVKDGVEVESSLIEWSLEGNDTSTTFENGVLTIGDTEADIAFITITATYEDLSESFEVVVAEDGLTVDITQDGTQDPLYTNEEYTFIATVKSGEANVPQETFVWTVLEKSDYGLVGSASATINNGVFIATEPGTYTIRGYLRGASSISNEVTVTVVSNGSSDNNISVELERGSTQAIAEDVVLENATISGNNSTGTKINGDGTISIGYFETADTITVTTADDVYTVNIIDGTTLDPRNDVALAGQYWWDNPTEGFVPWGTKILDVTGAISHRETSRLFVVPSGTEFDEDAETNIETIAKTKINETVTWEVVTTTDLPLPEGIKISVEDSVLVLEVPEIDADFESFSVYAITESGYITSQLEINTSE